MAQVQYKFQYKHRRSFSHSLRGAKYHGVFDKKYWQPGNFSSIKYYGKKISIASGGFWGWIGRIREWIKGLVPNFRSRKQRRLDIQYKADQEMLGLYKKMDTHNREADQTARRQDQRRK